LTWYLNPKFHETKYPEIAASPKWANLGIAGEKIAQQSILGVGFFFMDGARFQLPVGLHMVWRTSGDPAPRR